MRRLGRHRDHQPRDPGHRLARPGRRARSSSLGHPRHRGPRRAVGARPGPPDPGRVAGERQAPRASSATRASCDQIQDPARESRIATWFWGVQEIPDILDRWGHDLPPERVHLVTVPPPGGRRTCCGSGSAEAFGLDRPRPRPRGRARQPVARRARDRADAPDQLARPTARSSRRATGRWSASCSPTRRCRAGPARPRLALPPDVHPWAQELAGAWIDEIKDARVRRRRRPRRPGRRRRPPQPYADPDQPDEGEVADAARRRDQGAAAGERPAAATTEAAARRRARPGAPRPASGPTCGRRTGCARGSCAGSTASRVGRGLLTAYRGRGAGARGRRSGRPARSRSRRRPRRPARPPPAPAGPRSTASRLPATRVISSEATSAEISRSRSGSWAGAVASAIGGAGSFFFLTSASTRVLAEQADQDRVAHPRVVEVVAAQVGDAGDHPALDQGQAGDVGGDRSTAAVTRPPRLVTKPCAPAYRTWFSITSWIAAVDVAAAAPRAACRPPRPPAGSGPTPWIARCSASRTNVGSGPGASSVRRGRQLLADAALDAHAPILA